ncbi:hypothetical protein ACFSX9_12935 [Flavobacterium ardleyense]|uniref:Uncharacterized protein n=1 Tax=Flavobacterium ardleyense TaxID=2038737 RepID=A0ABW5ZC32_9FLAO
METYFLNLPISTKIAFISFSIGTLLFGTYFLIPRSNNLIIIGLSYTLIAITTNGIIFLKLIYNWIKSPTKRFSIEKQALIVLANIPIAILYFFIITNNIISTSPF